MHSSRRHLVVAAAALAGAATFLATTGCEMDSADAQIEIVPGGVVLAPGQTQTFRVTGGTEYAWSLDPDDGHGMLSTRQGDRVIFTLLSAGEAGEEGDAVTVIAVTCTSTIPGVSGTGSNSAYTATDTAYVHIAP